MPLSPSFTTPSSRVSATRRSLLLFASLLLALFVLANGLLVLIAYRQNDQASEHTILDVAKAVDTLQKDMTRTVRDYSHWGDAYRHLHPEVDLDWAYERSNIGAGLYRDFGFDAVFVIGPDNRTRYALIQGERRLVQADAWLAMKGAKLAERARDNDEEPILVMSEQGNQPLLLGASVITVGSDTTVQTQPGPDSVLVFVNVLDATELEAIGKSFGIEGLHVATAEEKGPGLDRYALALDDGSRLQLRWQAVRPGDELLWMILPLILATGGVFAFFAWLILRRALASAELLDCQYVDLMESRLAVLTSESRFRDVAEAATDWIWETDSALRFTYLSDRFETLTGHAVADWLGKPVDAFLECDEANSFAEWLQLYGGQSRTERHCRYVAANGTMRFCRMAIRQIGGRAGAYRGTATDITDELAARRRIEHLSQHDALTGLPNRTRLQEFLDGRLRGVPTLKDPLVMLSIDLDRFKPVNDSLGHGVGDQVLHVVSGRLRDCLREGDLVARLGGDEFILIVTGLSEQGDIEHLCQRIIDRIEQPIIVEGNEIFISCSIGIAMAPVDSSRADELLRFADMALYEAKGAGRRTWCFYAEPMNRRINERRQLEADLRKALQNDSELRLFYQPRYRVGSGRLAGAEALIRWQHPTLGLLSPDRFIPIAEDTGLIVSLSTWVMSTACREVGHWGDELFVSVNLSPTEFRHGQIARRVRAVLEETGIAPQRLELELTESVMLEDQGGALATMNELKSLGVRLSMDDFGTGYSSLSYLRTFPFDGLKIDRSFIASEAPNEDVESLMASIVGLGQALSLTVTAEGVETHEQLQLLQRIGCEEAQGYLLGRPMEASALRELARLRVSA